MVLSGLGQQATKILVSPSHAHTAFEYLTDTIYFIHYPNTATSQSGTKTQIYTG